MNLSSNLTSAAARRLRRGLILGIFTLVGTGALSSSLRAQDQGGNPGGNGNGNGGDNSDRRQRRGNFNPDQMIDNMRPQFDVADDAEWAVIKERITPIFDLARTAGGGRIGGGFRGGGGGGRRATGNPELDALQSAVTNNMPDAEIKARLERLREVRKENAVKLDKARADLLAVLTVKQEAVAVMMGLLQ